jgi:ketosteroid isomerase-like protein
MRAQTPGQIHELFVQAFNSFSAGGLAELYEESAVMLSPEGAAASGRAAVREAFAPVLAMKIPIRLETRLCVENGGVALLSCTWAIEGTDPGGNAVRLTGTSSEVARRQGDGTWLYVIDDPGFGR